MVGPPGLGYINSVWDDEQGKFVTREDHGPSELLVFDGKEFRLSGARHGSGQRPKIYFDYNGAVIGCHRITTEAMEELLRKWNVFKNKKNVYEVQNP